MLFSHSLALTEDRMRKLAPAMFASQAHDSVSDKFTFVPTIDVVRALQTEGWQPVDVKQTNARQLTRVDSKRHIVRLRHVDTLKALNNVGDSVPEAVLINAHDGTTAYQIHAGIFRMVCGNGMIVADATFEKIALKHLGFDPRQAIDAAFEVVREVPRLTESIEGMRTTVLSASEQVAFAESALIARYEDLKQSPVQPANLLRARRYDDQGDDLWRTFNRVQENMMRGGVRGRASTGRRLTTRPVTSIVEDTRLNKALWHLAESMKKAA